MDETKLEPIVERCRQFIAAGRGVTPHDLSSSVEGYVHLDDGERFRANVKLCKALGIGFTEINGEFRFWPQPY